ncbi:MAG: 3-phosphoshikimate 1-carboxyvinyltransferase, partial [Paenibacillaceae bacterium ZCTH02-B3]
MHVRVKPAARLEGDIQALSSKNYTTRYMLAAALAEGESELLHPARSEDSDAMRRCLRALGAGLEETENRLVIRGFGARPKAARELDVGNAGAVLRFLMSVAALCPGDVTFPNRYPESLGKRPHLDLIRALEQMNVRVTHRDGRLPITIHGGAPRGGRIRVSGSVSSQYLSSLLFLTPLLEEDSEIEVVNDLKSKVAVGQTLEVLEQAGIRVDASADMMHYRVPGRQRYEAKRYVVQGDYPGSAAILAAAAVTESDVKVHRLPEDSRQGERAAVDVLKAMGVSLVHAGGTVHVKGNGRLRAGEFDG